MKSSSIQAPTWRHLVAGAAAALLLILLVVSHGYTYDQEWNAESQKMELLSKAKPTALVNLGELEEWKEFAVLAMDGASPEFIRRHEQLKVQWNPKDIADDKVKFALHKLHTDGKSKPHVMQYEQIGLVANNLPNSGEAVLSFPDSIEIRENALTFFEIQPATARFGGKKKLRSQLLYAISADFFHHIKNWGKKVVKKVVHHVQNSRAILDVSRAACRGWIRNDPGNPPHWANRLQRCPRTYPFARQSFRAVCHSMRDTFYPDGACQNGNGCDKFHGGAYNCIRSMEGPYGQQCCYKRDNTICTNAPCGGTADYRAVPKNKWRHPDKVAAHFQHDVTPFINCCTLAKDRNLCASYMRLRPIDKGDKNVFCRHGPTAVYIRSKLSQDAIDVPGGWHRLGLRMQMWDYITGNQNQIFRVWNLHGGWTHVQSVRTGLYWDIYGAWRHNGALLIQWKYHGWGNQVFKFVHVRGKYYKILVRHSHKVVDIAGAHRHNGARIHQWAWHGGDNQLWYVEVA